MRLIAATFALVGMWGCAAAPRPSCAVPENGQITFVGTDRLNPDAEGRPLPTVVRLYQLSTLGEFEQADFESVWRTPNEVFADTLLGVEEVTLYPNNRLRWPFERNEDARFLVAVAVVRRPMGDTWRDIIELPAPVSVQTCGVELEEDDPPPATIPAVLVTVDDYEVRLQFSMTDASESCGELGCLADRISQPLDEAVESTDAVPDPPQTPLGD